MQKWWHLVKSYKWIFFIVLLVGILLAIWGFRANVTAGQVLLWQDLRELDYVDGRVPAPLSRYDGKIVRIPGYIVPLADNLSKFKEFLLVPDAMACIHVPPPPPNQMVYVLLEKDIGLDQAFGPVWVTGELNIKTSGSVYGDASYTLENSTVRPYEF